jgi:hypothetical protein
VADNIMAAQIIRDTAIKMGSQLAHEKLATISKAMSVVLRRYGSSSEERRRSASN